MVRVLRCAAGTSRRRRQFACCPPVRSVNQPLGAASSRSRRLLAGGPGGHIFVCVRALVCVCARARRARTCVRACVDGCAWELESIGAASSDDIRVSTTAARTLRPLIPLKRPARAGGTDSEPPEAKRRCCSAASGCGASPAGWRRGRRARGRRPGRRPGRRRAESADRPPAHWQPCLSAPTAPRWPLGAWMAGVKDRRSAGVGPGSGDR